MTAPLQPADPTAPALAAAMATPELAALPVITARVLRRLTTLWVTLWGSVRVLPSSAVPGPTAGQGARYVLRPGTAAVDRRQGLNRPGEGSAAIDFPQVWTDAVDDGVSEVIEAMERAGESVRREVETAPVRRPIYYRSGRVRAAVAPSQVAKRGFAAVQEALAQPARLREDVETAVSGDLVWQHTQDLHDEARARGGDWVLIWVAERDACVRCLAYAGEHVLPGAKFEGGLTFGPRWASVVGRPPLAGPGWFEGEGSHPNCRCELRLIRRRDVEPAADALKREARRSIAKGWARPTEGNTVRVVAAERLLSGAANLPKTVVAEARSRLHRPGSFRRAVPSP
jgi:hypothetical protein